MLALPKFEEFIATLMKVRLGLFDQGSDDMFTRLEPLMKWTECKELQKNSTTGFQGTLQESVVIMDCFEIFYKRPKLLKARAQTYSNYQHHNTVKFVLGIAPQGSTYKRLLAYVYCAEIKLLPFYKRQKTVEEDGCSLCSPAFPSPNLCGKSDQFSQAKMYNLGTYITY